jgi:hypothetical protein
MTLPTSGPLSLTDVMNELRVANPSRAYPISLGDSDVLALAGKSAPPISLTDLYGKSSYVYTPMTVTGNNDSGYEISSGGAGAVECHPSVTVSGGEGVKTFYWEFTANPNGCSLSNATSQSCTVSKSYVKDSIGTADATLRCTVTDSTGASVAREGITAHLEWEY